LPPAAERKKAGGLGRKLGPLPLWAWLAGGLVLGYIGWRYLTGSSGSAGPAQQTQTTAAQTPVSATGNLPTAGSPADTGQTTSDLVSALGGQQANLLQAFEAQNQDVLALAQSQIAAAQQSPQISPSSTSETQQVASQQPGGANVPIITFVSPQALAPVSSQPAAATTVKPKPQPVVSQYYTYKRDVPLKSGQTVHYTPGRGYYAA
jgi:hypothetical protein